MTARKKATYNRRGRPKRQTLVEFDAGVLKLLDWATKPRNPVDNA